MFFLANRYCYTYMTSNPTSSPTSSSRGVHLEPVPGPGTPEYFQGLWGDRNTANFDEQRRNSSENLNYFKK